MSFPDPVLDPFSQALAGVVAGAHAALTHLGADPASGLTWVLCLAAVVAVVRIALLPLVVHGVRSAHAAARARPRLQELTKRYRNRADPESRRAFLAERRLIATDHGMSRLGCLPLLLQVPIWFALYRLVSDVAAGTPVGAMGTDLVATLGAATLLGVPLAERGYLGAGWAHLAVVAGLAGAAAALAFVDPAVPGRPQHGLDRPAGRHGADPADPACGLGCRPAGGWGCGPGRAARLLGLQLGLDPRPVGGRVAVVPDARFASRPARLRAMTLGRWQDPGRWTT